MADFHKEHGSIRLTCPKGMAPYVAQEARELGYETSREDHTGVDIEGTLKDCVNLNIQLSTAHKVLFQIQQFRAKNPDELYKKLREISWEHYLKVNSYFSIDNFVKNEHIQDTRFASLKTKDAIADRFHSLYGKRPNSGAGKEKAVLFLYWEGEKAVIFLDTSGEPIDKHGYRKNTGAAPLSEALASAIIKATDWDVAQPFINPMCGTGTLAIEAALKALNRPPGLFRNNFGFMHLRGYDSRIFNKIRNEVRKNVKQSTPVKIIASDHDKDALKAAEANARKAGVLKFIQFYECPFDETPLPEGQGTIVINPPYGERLADEEDLYPIYRSIGDFYKQNGQGYQGFVFTGNLGMAKQVGLKSKYRIPFYNGKIECRLIGYNLY